MGRYLLERLLQLVVVAAAVTAIVFFALRAGPASPAELATEGVRDPAEIDRIRHEWKLDQPVYLQYIDYMQGVVRGDFGRSFNGNVPVAQVLAERLPATLELTALSMLIGTGVGLVLGVVAAVKTDGVVDFLFRALALLAVSLPGFWLGLMFIGLFSVTLGWLPVGGRFDARVAVSPITGFYFVDMLLRGDLAGAWTVVRYLALPASVLGLTIAGLIARIARTTTVEALRQDYIRTAKGKGLSQRTVVLRHALRNALLPIVTILGLQFGNLLGGAAVTETVFSWPGLGKLMVDAIYVRDFPQIQGSVMLLACTYVAVNLLVDVLYAVIDPRIRLGGAH